MLRAARWQRLFRSGRLALLRASATSPWTWRISGLRGLDPSNFYCEAVSHVIDGSYHDRAQAWVCHRHVDARLVLGAFLRYTFLSWRVNLQVLLDETAQAISPDAVVERGVQLSQFPSGANSSRPGHPAAQLQGPQIDGPLASESHVGTRPPGSMLVASASSDRGTDYVREHHLLAGATFCRLLSPLHPVSGRTRYSGLLHFGSFAVRRGKF